MYDFVERHFLHHTNPDSRELAYQLEPQRDLDCGIPAANKTSADIYSEWLQRPTPFPEIPDGPAAAKRTQADLIEQIRDVLGIRERAAPPNVRVQVATSRGNVLLRQLIIEPEDGIRLPAVEIQPRSAITGVVILPGKSALAPVAVSSMLSAGLSVVFVDLRGTGEINSGGRRTDNWAWFMGRPWTGMWTRDIAAVTEALGAEHPDQRVGVIGTGQFARSVMFAAALCPRVAAYAVRLEEATYRDDIREAEVSDVPRILAVTDMPIVAALSAPRPSRIEFPPGLDERFQQAYGWTRKFSEHGFNTTGPQLQPAETTDWSALALWFARNLR